MTNPFVALILLAAGESQHMVSPTCVEIAQPSGAPIGLCGKSLRLARFSWNRLDGYCLMELTVRPEGSVARAKLRRAKPRSALESYCVKSAYKWRFEPPTVNGAPVTAKVRGVRALILLGETQQRDPNPQVDTFTGAIIFDSRVIDATLEAKR